MSRGVANWLPVQIPQDKLVDPWKFFHIGLKLGIKSGGAALYPCSSIFTRFMYENSILQYYWYWRNWLLTRTNSSERHLKILPNWNQIWSSILISILLQFHKILRIHKQWKNCIFYFVQCWIIHKSKLLCEFFFLRYHLKYSPLLNMNWGCQRIELSYQEQFSLYDLWYSFPTKI